VGPGKGDVTFRPVPAARVTIVSDTHLSSLAPEADTNWEAVLRYIADVKPDLVVHVGDLSLDGAFRVDDLHYARRQLDRLDVPWRAVPGNHDTGDNPFPGKPREDIDATRIEQWRAIVGEAHWSVEVGGWFLIGIDAQLFGSGLDDEAAQWRFLDTEFAGRDRHDPTMMIVHKPFGLTDTELQAPHPHRYVPEPARQKLMDIVRAERIRLVVSGHVHQYRRLDLDGAHHLWAPTTWAVLPDEMQPTIGLKRSGVVQLDLEADGTWDAQLVEPDGLLQLTALHDVPNRYPDH
jgi:3',5'-cyclic AMP phosphodiesterase CpdA